MAFGPIVSWALLALSAEAVAQGAPGDEPPPTPPPPDAPVPAESAPGAPPGSVPIVEPPTPGEMPLVIYEPPPPPTPRHVSPASSLWVGVRVGWFVPFGSAYARGVPAGAIIERHHVPLRDYLSTGPAFELDLGLRLARHYNVFALWERAELGAGRGDGGLLGDHGELHGGDTDFWALGVRASSDPDGIGFVSEIAIGYRRARAQFEDRTALELTQGLFEARLGFGADIRVSPRFSLTPLAAFGVGVFANADLVDANGDATDLLAGYNDADGHGWFTLQLGGHFDFFGRP